MKSQVYTTSVQDLINSTHFVASDLIVSGVATKAKVITSSNTEKVYPKEMFRYPKEMFRYPTEQFVYSVE